MVPYGGSGSVTGRLALEYELSGFRHRPKETGIQVFQRVRLQECVPHIELSKADTAMKVLCSA